MLYTFSSSSAKADRELSLGPIDVASAIVGCAILVSPLIVYTNAVLGSPLREDTVRTIVLASCGVGTVFLMLGYWSLDRLWTSVLVLIATAIGTASIGAGIVLTINVEIPGSDPAPVALVWAIAYSITYVVVNRFGVRL